MSKLAAQVTKLHQPMDKALIRVLSIALGAFHIVMLMWDPKQYAAMIGGFNEVISPLLIWAVCSSMIYGIGFKPKSWFWQLLFSPYICLPILLYLTVMHIV
ncbi:cyd operon protein YbgE [Vibrio profundum]|uniref:cyd operon protein YbgE n=1 Tax=Vibrio profundum TaxID=2910247 RepID=UPI003D0ADF9F